MNPQVLQVLADNLIAYRKEKGISAHHLVKIALEMGFKIGIEQNPPDFVAPQPGE